MEEDFYKLLGVGRSASDADIRKAYHKLARECHPDLHPEDKAAREKFKSLQKAYGVLGDKEKRKLYDQYGSAYEEAAAARAGGWAPHGNAAGFDEIDFTQLFGDKFFDSSSDFGDIFRRQGRGGSSRSSSRKGSSRRPHRGGDITHEMEIPFTIAVTGGKIALALQRGSGAKETIEVQIPQGIDEGQTIRCRGQGDAGGGIPGDLLITIHIAQHSFFRRRGRDLVVRVPVTLAEAALGAKVDVPSPWGTIAIKIPPGSSSGKRLRVKGHGVRTADVRGDLYAEVHVQLPDRLDEEALELIRKLDHKNTRDPRADLKW